MKSTLKIFLAVSLFSSITLADGDMGTGNKSCTQQNCLAFEQTDKDTKEANSLLEYVQEFLVKILG